MKESMFGICQCLLTISCKNVTENNKKKINFTILVQYVKSAIKLYKKLRQTFLFLTVHRSTKI